VLGPPPPGAAVGGAADDAPAAADVETLAERLAEQGADRLSDAELVALLIGRRGRARDDDRAAADLLDAFRSLRRMAVATPAEIARVAGAPLGSAARLAAAFALGRRTAARRWTRGAPLKTSLDVFERFHPVLRDATKERFLAVLLDGRNRVLRADAVSEGTLTSSLVHPREVFAPAMREAASALVCVHNHPSGDPEPSVEDVEITRRLVAASEILGIRLLDHVVIGDGAYASFLDRGWIAR
jgi:DNA repair protein RadC